MYLKESGTTDAEFVLPRSFHLVAHGYRNAQGESNALLDEFDFVQEEALYTWVQNKMGYNGTFSYQQLQRVCSQLRSYPDRRIWSLDVGGGWMVMRNRSVVRVGRTYKKDS